MPPAVLEQEKTRKDELVQKQREADEEEGVYRRVGGDAKGAEGGQGGGLIGQGEMGAFSVPQYMQQVGARLETPGVRRKRTRRYVLN